MGRFVTGHGWDITLMEITGGDLGGVANFLALHWWCRHLKLILMEWHMYIQAWETCRQ